MPLKRRRTPPSYPPEKRQGYIDPREHDDPPFPPGHPFGNRSFGCVCCTPGCSCCHGGHLQNVVSRDFKPRHTSERKGRRYSVPSPPWSGLSTEIPGPKSASLPTYLDKPVRSLTTPTSWPFLRTTAPDSYDGTTCETPTERNHHGNSVLGPLGALIAELHSTTSSAQLHASHTFFEAREGHELNTKDMRQIWAHWIRARGQKRDERRGMVQRGRGSITLVGDAGEQWRCAEVHGWI